MWDMGSISSKKHGMEIAGNLEYGINIFQKTLNGNLVLDMGSISAKEHGMQILQCQLKELKQLKVISIFH